MEKVMSRKMDSNDVFRYYCNVAVGIMNYFNVIPATKVADKLHISNYKARKLIKELVSEGLLEPTFDGGYDEECGVFCIRGYSVTNKGKESIIFKKALWRECKLCAECFESEDAGGAYSYWKGFKVGFER